MKKTPAKYKYKLGDVVWIKSKIIFSEINTFDLKDIVSYKRENDKNKETLGPWECVEKTIGIITNIKQSGGHRILAVHLNSYKLSKLLIEPKQEFGKIDIFENCGRIKIIPPKKIKENFSYIIDLNIQIQEELKDWNIVFIY